jgi:LemA protein
MNNAIFPLLIVAVPLLLALVWFIASFNRFVRLKQHIRESWSGIDVELKRRYDLIPNLVETVKGYAAHERAVLEDVVKLRNRAASSEGPASDQAADESALALGMKRLFVVVENYPHLKSDANFRMLQTELANTEDRLAAARRFFNGNVRELNQMCESFPTNLLAGMFGFERATYFELSADAERVVPRVAV